MPSPLVDHVQFSLVILGQPYVDTGSARGTAPTRDIARLREAGFATSR